MQHGLGRVESLLADTPVRSLRELRSTLAAHLSLDLEFVSADEDFGRIAAVHGHSFPFPLDRYVHGELNAAEGVLLRKTRRKPGQRQFLAAIDERGTRSARSYFTAWHELAHLLVMHPANGCEQPDDVLPDRDPIESVVDELAARLAFYRPLFRPVLQAEMGRDRSLSFATIERVRAACAPEASLLATAIASVLCAPEPVCLLHAQSAPEHDQSGPSLYVDRITWSESAWDAGLRIEEGCPVPRRSILHAVHGTGTPHQTVAAEDQSWWEAAGGTLPPLQLRIAAISRARFVYAIVGP